MSKTDLTVQHGKGGHTWDRPGVTKAVMLQGRAGWTDSQGGLTAPGDPSGAGLGVPAQPAQGTQLGWRSTGGTASPGGAQDDPGSSEGTGFGF